MPPVNKIKQKIERFLYKKGFTEAPLRAIILAQLALLAVTFTAGIILLYFSAWLLWFFLGAALLAFNFWSMSRFLLEQLPGGYSRAFLRGQLIRFFGRILLTGIVLAAAITFGASIAALCLGLLSCLAVTGIIAVARLSGRAHKR